MTDEQIDRWMDKIKKLEEIHVWLYGLTDLQMNRSIDGLTD